MKQKDIDNKVGEGYRVVPVFTHSQKDYRRMVLEYRLIKGDTHYVITRYQAKKHMSKQQLIDVNDFEEILKENRDIKSQCFGRQLELRDKRRKLRADDVRLDTMLGCVEEMQYTEFV